MKSFNKNNISKISKLFVIFVLLCSMPILNISAVSDIDYSLYCQNCDEDRLFTVDVIADGNTDIAAVTLHINFDPEYMDFRSVSVANSAFEIDHAVENGRVSVIILCAFGYKLNGKARLVTYKFKSLKSGKTNINLSVQDPVNSKCKSIPIGKVSSTQLTINSKGVKKSVKSKTSYAKKSNKKNKSTDPQPVTAEQFSDFDVIDKTSESVTPYFLAGLGGAGVILILVVVYNMGKNSNKKDDENDKTE